MSPRSPSSNKNEEKEANVIPLETGNAKNEIAKLNRLLGSVMRYLSDDEQEEIDIEYLLENTEGLRDWWTEYRELDRKRVEEEIRSSLVDLSLEELESIREQLRHKG